jgi:KDO2-lipid IV(A) lauroyltransferase
MPVFKNNLKSLSHLGEYLFVRLLAALVRVLPLPAALRLGELLGASLFHVIRIRRGVVLEQLSRAFPEKDRGALLQHGAECYKNLCKIAVETVRCREKDVEEMSRFIQVRGIHHLDRALAGGKGLVVVTFHFGNWELMGSHVARLGYPVNVVVQRIHNPFIDRMVLEMRNGMGMRTIERKRAFKESYRALKKNMIVAFLADQDARENGVFVPFFHKPASTPKGPAILAIRCGAPAATAIMIRRGNGRFEIVIEPIEFEHGGNLEQDVKRFTRTYTTRLEEYVKSYPEQWLWHHRRWKTALAKAG